MTASTFAAEFERAFLLHQQGKLREAFLRYDAILKAAPAHAPALHYSGVVLYQSGKLEAAAQRIRQSLVINPAVADAWSNFGLVLQSSGQVPAAVDAFRQAAALEPASPEILANYAATLFAAGQTANAEAAARLALKHDPLRAAAWYVLAHALDVQGRTLEALDSVTRAAGLAPAEERYAGLKAQIEARIGAVDRARQTLETALARHPSSSALRLELASVLDRQGDDVAAARTYEQVLKLEERHGAALSELMVLRGRLADWHDWTDLVARYRAGVAAGMPYLSPFALLALPSTRDEQRKCADAWTTSLAGNVRRKAPERTIATSQRIRIGYLSSDFHTHATTFLAVGLFERHDRTQFEVLAYSSGVDDGSPMRARVVRAFDRFVDLRGRDPIAIADAIEADRIDVLIDLKGHTQGASPVVLARRPAPIQVHYLGYPGTLAGGLADYLIGDTIVTPPEHAADYAETLAILPGAYQVNDRARPIDATPARATLGLPDGAIVLCAFNQSFKINPPVMDAWASILKAVPESVLWLLARKDDDPAIANLRSEAAARGIDPDRLVFSAHRPNAEYLALYRHASLYLDTWPYNAHTTASDALWSGCPVLTILGATFASRVAASLVTAVGLPELVMATVDEYITRAIALAQDPVELARLKAYLEGPGRSSPLFDTHATTRALEAAYLGMVEQRRKGIRRAFRVAAVTDEAV